MDGLVIAEGNDLSDDILKKWLVHESAFRFQKARDHKTMSSAARAGPDNWNLMSLELFTPKRAFANSTQPEAYTTNTQPLRQKSVNLNLYSLKTLT